MNEGNGVPEQYQQGRASEKVRGASQRVSGPVLTSGFLDGRDHSAAFDCRALERRRSNGFSASRRVPARPGPESLFERVNKRFSVGRNGSVLVLRRLGLVFHEYSLMHPKTEKKGRL